MKKKSVERKLKRYFQEQSEYLPPLAIEGATNNRRSYSARRMQKPLLIALTAYLAISIAVVAFVAVRYLDRVGPAATTAQDPKETEDPAFEIRRPSAEQDALFSMERITEDHGASDYLPRPTAEEIIETADNPIYQKSLFRVSILQEEVATEPNEYGKYITTIQCRVEEIYFVPDNINIEVGGTNIYISEYRGMIDGKMWYYKGDIPVIDCYDYYVIADLKEYQDTYTVGGMIPITVPVVDCYEQYYETLEHYGFNPIDYSTLGGSESMESCINCFKYWFEDPDNLQSLKERFVEDEIDAYWKNIADPDRHELVTQQLADQIIPGGSVYDVVDLLGKPQSVIEYYDGGCLVYHLSEDGSMTMKVTYNYPSYTVTTVDRDYLPYVDLALLDRIEEEMTYDEIVQLIGAPHRIYYAIEGSISSRSFMTYYFDEDWSSIAFWLDFTQTPTTAELITIIG